MERDCALGIALGIMQYMEFATNRSVSLVLGGNVFGWTADRAASFEVLDAYQAHGGTLIDTSDSYSQWAPGNDGGESETVLGEWLASRPAEGRPALTSKVGQAHHRPGLSAANIEAALKDTLGRLGVPAVDLYYAHFDEEGRSVEEIARAFSGLRAAGLIGGIGVSNLSTARIAEWLAVAEREGLRAPTVIQKEYSLMERGIETDAVPLAERHGMTVQTYYSLARGFLTGKYRDGAATVDSPRAGVASGYLDERGRAVLGVLDEVASRHRAIPAAVSLAWLASRPGIGGVVASARTPAQFSGLVEATRLELRADDIDELERVSRRPQATAGRR